MNILTILIAILLSITSYSEAFASNNKLPASVFEYILKQEVDCRPDNSSKQQLMKTKADEIVKRADLNADGITDFMFFDDDIYCEMGASFRNGNGGVGVVIFVGTKDGNAKLAFEKTVYDARIEKVNSKNIVWLTVGGAYCGQKNFKSRSDAIACERPLVWNKSTENFDFALPSETKFLK